MKHVSVSPTDGNGPTQGQRKTLTRVGIREGQILFDEKENYRPLALPMALETSQKAKELINALHHKDHIDDMTKKWLSLTPNPPRIPVFYTPTKIHKSN